MPTRVDSKVFTRGFSETVLTATPTPRRRRAVAAAVLLGALAGCSGSAGDGGKAGAVWTPSASKLVAEDRGGGFLPVHDAGADGCTYGRTFTLTVADRKLAWRVCAPTTAADPVYKATDGGRVLTTTELGVVLQAVEQVTISSETRCGADKGTLLLTISNASGDRQYLDDFYACEKQGTYVTNIDLVFEALVPLAK
jgi:hypothetical protein